MTDATIKLIFAGSISLGGMLAAFAVTLTGMTIGWPVAEILAINLVFSNVVVGGMGFFLGHQNNRRNNAVPKK